MIKKTLLNRSLKKKTSKHEESLLIKSKFLIKSKEIIIKKSILIIVFKIHKLKFTLYNSIKFTH